MIHSSCNHSSATTPPSKGLHSMGFRSATFSQILAGTYDMKKITNPYTKKLPVYLCRPPGIKDIPLCTAEDYVNHRIIVYHRSLYDVSLPLVVIIAFSTVISFILLCTDVALVAIGTVVALVASSTVVAFHMISYRRSNRILGTVVAIHSIVYCRSPLISLVLSYPFILLCTAVAGHCIFVPSWSFVQPSVPS